MGSGLDGELRDCWLVEGRGIEELETGAARVASFVDLLLTCSAGSPKESKPIG